MTETCFSNNLEPNTDAETDSTKGCDSVIFDLNVHNFDQF